VLAIGLVLGVGCGGSAPQTAANTARPTLSAPSPTPSPQIVQAGSDFQTKSGLVLKLDKVEDLGRQTTVNGRFLAGNTGDHLVRVTMTIRNAGSATVSVSWADYSSNGDRANLDIYMEPTKRTASPMNVGPNRVPFLPQAPAGDFSPGQVVTGEVWIQVTEAADPQAVTIRWRDQPDDLVPAAALVVGTIATG
jgi:hypothetical protein